MTVEKEKYVKKDVSVDYTLVDAEVSRNMYERSEREWLVYHAPVDYYPGSMGER